MIENNNTFQGLGIAPKFLEILSKNNYVTPTPIQTQSIPVGIQGKDVIGIAQTGTGKTLAFGVPMLQNLVQHKGKGLVILPTRELALQVDETFQKIGRSLGLKTAVLIGGEDIKRQIRKLKNDPHVIIATPGRLIDHIEQKTCKLDTVKILVLDEADRMFDMGFAPQIKKVMAKVPANRQTMLYSATMPQEIVSLAVSYMKKPTRVEVAPAGTTAKDITQELFFVDKPDKPKILNTLLEKYKGAVLVFTRTKYEAKKVAKLVRDMNHSASEIHSNRSLGQRKEALQGFKLGKYRVLVATDIAARGIDVTGIELVINYDLPANAEDYVHRIGRTGRAGSVGRAISFAMPNQRADVRSIERVIKKTISVSEHGLGNTGHQIRPPVQTPRPYTGRPTSARQVVGRPQRTQAARSYSERPQGNRFNEPKQHPEFANRKPNQKPAYHKREDRNPRNQDRPGRMQGYSKNESGFKSDFNFIEDAPVKRTFSHAHSKPEGDKKPYKGIKSFGKSKPFGKSRNNSKFKQQPPKSSRYVPQDEPFVPHPIQLAKQNLKRRS